MSEDRRRHTVTDYVFSYLRRRWYYVAVISFLLAVVVILLVVSSSLSDYGGNLSLNLAADLIGVIVVLFAITPFIERAEFRRDSVLDRFDHRAFIRQAADARRKIMILETWTELLQDEYQNLFLKSLRTALKQNVEVRILLLDPDAKAAEQRTNDLLRQTDVVDNIMNNLQALHRLWDELSDRLRENLEIRIYSALPPVQMYRVDDHIVVSFFPVSRTSWNTTQYQTSPRAQLGEFVSEKFDELWDASNTRTLDRFWVITLRVDSGEHRRSYQVRFVTSDEETYAWGEEIARDHLENGIGGLRVRIVEDELELPGLYSFHALDARPEDYRTAQELFDRKYGQKGREVLKLVERPSG